LFELSFELLLYWGVLAELYELDEYWGVLAELYDVFVVVVVSLFGTAAATGSASQSSLSFELWIGVLAALNLFSLCLTTGTTGTVSPLPPASSQSSVGLGV
jgi:hypothetical protein